MKAMKGVMVVVLGLLMGLVSVGANAQSLNMKVALIKGGLHLLTTAVQAKPKETTPADEPKAVETAAVAAAPASEPASASDADAKRAELMALPKGGLTDLPPDVKAKVMKDAMATMARVYALNNSGGTLPPELQEAMAKQMGMAVKAQAAGPVSALGLEGDPMKPEIVKEVAVRAATDAALLAIGGKSGVVQAVDAVTKKDESSLLGFGSRVARLLASK